MSGMTEKKTLRAVAVHDLADEKSKNEELHFHVLEGPCAKCKRGDNVLVIYDLKLNTRDTKQSLFRTQCIACGHQDMHYAANVQRD